MATAAEDPIRADVERRLRAVVDLALAGPLGTLRGIDACLRRRVDSARVVVETPMQVLRSLFDLVAAPAERDVTADRVVIDTDVRAPVADAGRPAPGTSASADLPIDEYESLAASQVVARLNGLTPPDLHRVRNFEADHRGRRTVLGKIDQLLAET